MLFHKNGEIVKFKTQEFKNEKEKYEKMWKLKYNIELPKKHISENNMLDFICGKKNSI